MFEWLRGKRYKYENTRQYLRIPASWPIKWEEERTQAEMPRLTSTKDVSAGGVRVEVREMIPVGSRIRVEVHVPPLQRSIGAQAQVVRCLLVKGGSFELGIRFVQIDPQDQAALNEAIRRFTNPQEIAKQEKRSWWRKAS